MSKTVSILAGIAAGLITVLVLNELIKSLFIVILLNQAIVFNIKGIGLYAQPAAGFSHDFFINLVILTSPLVFIIVLFEISLYYSRKDISNIRHGLIIFQLILMGYLIFNILLGAVSLLLNSSFKTDWLILLQNSGYTHPQQLLLMLVVLALLFTYLNFSSKRLKRNIPVVIRKKQKQ